MSPGTAVRIAIALPGLLREAEAEGAAAAPLLVAGPPASAAELARELARGGDRALVRALSVAGLGRAALEEAAALVYVVRSGLTPTDERVLREAGRRRLPLVVLVVDGKGGGVLPYVRATDVVRAASVDAAAAAAVAERVAARGCDAVWPLARALPVLRGPVAGALVRRAAGRSLLAAASPAGPDPSAVVLGQARMVLRIGVAYGVDREHLGLLALAGAAGAGLALRALVRSAAVRLGPPALAEAAAAYAGTRALGEAAAALAVRGRW